MTTTISIHDIADQMDRLCPSQVDTTERDWGHGVESGHIGHDHGDDDYHTLGWFAEAGNVGNPVFAVHAEDIEELHRRLAALPDGALDSGITRSPAFEGLRVKWLY